MKKVIVAATMFLAIAAVSCKKDDDKQPTTFELITANTWKIDTMGWDMDGNGAIDGALALKPCELDNTLTFSTDSTGAFDEGATKCVDTDAQTTAFTWKLNDSTKVLTIMGNIPGELEGDVTVLSATDANLKLSKHIVTNFPVAFDGNLIVELQK